MDTTQRKRIIKRFLTEICSSNVIINDQVLADYPALEEIIALIQRKGRDVIDFSQLEHTPALWQKFKDILHHSVQFSDNSNPPSLLGYRTGNLLSRLDFWRRDEQLQQLPANNYYRRHTEKIDNPELLQLKNAARRGLMPLVHTLFAGKLDIYNDKKIEQYRNSLIQISQKRALTKNEGNQLIVLNDLIKLNKLELIAVPDDNNKFNLFCTLAEKTTGVTEKVALISFNTVRQQLKILDHNPSKTIDEYLSNRKHHELSTEAMIKLPKHGKSTEVQHEAIALNIARILGLETTRSTSITHEGQPALFIPFDNIQLMSNFAKGQIYNAFASQNTYEHYATINPVGAGLQADEYVDDFGSAFALFYLCSDTDAMGGYNQNKALRNGRHLYIFDQVIMAQDKLALDSRISLQPSEFLLKHTRHGQGRNRTLIEDSSLTSKFDSLLQLQSKKNLICQYCDRLAFQHHQRERELEKILKNKGLDKKTQKIRAQELEEVKNLKKDAHHMRDIIAARIDKISAVLPRYDHEKVSDNEVKHALLLEKLLHNPRLFTNEGRPYKNPWTNRHKSEIKEISALEDNKLVLSFSQKFPAEIFAWIKEQLPSQSMINLDNNRIIIDRRDLLFLNEKILHPEAAPVFQNHKNYFDFQELQLISQGYDDAQQSKILQTIASYQKNIDSAPSNREKIMILHQTEAMLHRLSNTAKDKGFAMHILKKFQFENQQKLQGMIPLIRWTEQINFAFIAAAKLDRLHEFNLVLAEAILHNQLATPNFRDFLQECIGQEARVRSHPEAVNASTQLHKRALQTIAQFSYQPQVNDELRQARTLNLLEERLHDLGLEAELFAKEEINLRTETILEGQTEPVKDQLNTVFNGNYNQP